MTRWRIVWALLALLIWPVVASCSAESLEELLPGPLPVLTAPDQKLVVLGQALFFDRRLSGDSTMNCAVCHIPAEGFANGQPLSPAYPTTKHWRHSQGLINAAYLERLFWDGRAESLEEQAVGPIESPFEMNLNLDYLVARLREEPAYRKAFQAAFGAEVTRERILAALAAFERTLVVNDSPFDRYLAGDRQALGDKALQGAGIFYGSRGGCARCHAGPLLSDQKFHNLGVPESQELLNDPLRRATRNFFLYTMKVEPMERDPGRYAVTRNRADMGAFRTPPLRQVAQTAPYMHNGALGTLEDVIDFFDRGGGDDPGKSPLLQPLHLTAGEKEALKIFLESLSGTLPSAKPVNLE